MLGGCGFQGQVTAGDDSDKKGKMGAGYHNLKRKKEKAAVQSGLRGRGLQLKPACSDIVFCGAS